MLVRRFDPFHEIRILEDRFLRNYQAEVAERDASISAFSPSVNTREGEFAYHVDIDLPGVKKEDIKVDLKEGQLSVSGERHFKEEVKEEDYYKVETNFGKFTRTFSLPESVDIENIDASMDNGVLEIVIPKLAKQENMKSIAIK
jgi:HSP20 family protein